MPGRCPEAGDITVAAGAGMGGSQWENIAHVSRSSQNRWANCCGLFPCSMFPNFLLYDSSLFLRKRVHAMPGRALSCTDVPRLPRTPLLILRKAKRGRCAWKTPNRMAETYSSCLTYTILFNHYSMLIYTIFISML